MRAKPAADSRMSRAVVVSNLRQHGNGVARRQRTSSSCVDAGPAGEAYLWAGMWVGVDGGAAEGAAGGALEPGRRAGPVEAVAAGEVRQHVARAELVQAHRALRLLRRGPPQAAPPHQPPHHALPRVHLPLHAGHRRRRGRALAALLRAAAHVVVGSAQLYAPRAVVPEGSNRKRSVKEAKKNLQTHRRAGR